MERVYNNLCKSPFPVFPQCNDYASFQVEPKFLRNMKFARKHNLPGAKQQVVAAARAKKREALMAKATSV